MRACSFNTSRRVRNQVSDKAVKNTFQRLVKDQLLGNSRVAVSCLAVMPRKQIHAVRNLLDREQPRFVAIVEVGGVVGNLVGKIDKLRFERRALIEQILGEFRMVFGIIIVRMLDDALADFEGQIQYAESGITDFEVFRSEERRVGKE